jgi:uncharacterized membrane protein
MSNITETIDVAVPVRTAYNQWTQFESFPQFMQGVNRVEQLSDRRNRWTVEIAGAEREFTTEITEQTPDQRIAWATIEGDSGHAGVVSFHPVDAENCRVHLDMVFAPEGLVEQAGDKLGVVSRRVRGDLERFKQFIEDQGIETGAWRGTVHRDN